MLVLSTAGGRRQRKRCVLGAAGLEGFEEEQQSAVFDGFGDLMGKQANNPRSCEPGIEHRCRGIDPQP